MAADELRTLRVASCGDIGTCMTRRIANVAVLGSTGSIGRSTLEVIAASRGRLRAVALSAHSNLDLLVEQARAFARAGSWPPIRWRPRRTIGRGLPSDVELLVGPEALETGRRRTEVDIVVAAIVGSAGLRGTWAALEAGKTVALANKETWSWPGRW